MIYQQRMTATTNKDFVVFIIGMRINTLWKVHKWLPVARAMPKMIRELQANTELGLLAYEQWLGRTTIMVQYWESFEKLDAYAKSKTSQHLPAWAAFNKQIAQSGVVGIWHETYLSGQGRFECVYNNMPRFGLAGAIDHVPAKGKLEQAASRIKA